MAVAAPAKAQTIPEVLNNRHGVLDSNFACYSARSSCQTCNTHPIDVMYDVNWTLLYLKSPIVFLPQNPSDSDQDALCSLIAYMATARSLCDAPVMPMLTSLQLESLPRGQLNACPTATDRVSHQACYAPIQFLLHTDTSLSLRKSQMPG